MLDDSLHPFLLGLGDDVLEEVLPECIEHVKEVCPVDDLPSRHRLVRHVLHELDVSLDFGQYRLDRELLISRNVCHLHHIHREDVFLTALRKSLLIVSAGGR